MKIEKNIITQVTGRGMPMGGDDIDTDRIIPGRFLLCTTFKGLGESAFADDKAAPGHPFADPAHANAAVLLSGRNFGCGSSREHAPQALRRWGIQAIMAESFAEIFHDNARACGIVCVRAEREDIEAVIAAVKANPGLEIALDVEGCSGQAGGLEFTFNMDDAIRARFLDGTWDVLDVLMEAAPEIEAKKQALPYMAFQKT